MYTWKGMEKITREEAVRRWKEDKEVYLLYDDDTESYANSIEDIIKFDGEFGYEKTAIIAAERNAVVEITCEWEINCYHARVYENWGGEWHKTHESNPYSIKEDAMKSYKRFVKRYIK